jgi:hypothetical protein
MNTKDAKEQLFAACQVILDNISSFRLEELGGVAYQKAADTIIYNKKDAILFWRLAAFMDQDWKSTAKLKEKTKDGKERSWRKPRATLKQTAPRGEGRKPWNTENKARMALVRRMSADEVSLNQTVERLYGKGKNFAWFVANYDAIKSGK